MKKENKRKYKANMNRNRKIWLTKGFEKYKEGSMRTKETKEERRERMTNLRRIPEIIILRDTLRQRRIVKKLRNINIKIIGKIDKKTEIKGLTTILWKRKE